MKPLAILLLCCAFLVSARTSDPKKLLTQAKQAKPPEAIALLEQANDIWAKQSSKDPEYAESLDRLAILLRTPMSDDPQAWKAEAAPLAQHALEIRESHPDTAPEDLALALEIEADVLGRYEAGAPFWKRAAEIRAQRVSAVRREDTGGPPPEKMGGTGITQPVLIHKREPEYSEDARLARISGSITLSLVINSNGVPGNFQLVRGIGYGLDEKAAEAVSTWRFKPGTKDGQPVATMAHIEVNFRLL